MGKRAAVLLADGFEETEAITVIDVLRRAGVHVDVLGVTGKAVVGSHAITVGADLLLDDVGAAAYDVVVLPGGMPGAASLRDSDKVKALVVRQHQAGKLVAAICAAPMALAAFGVLEGKQATCFPGFEDKLKEGGASPVVRAVVKDQNVVTSRGVGTALAFSLALVEALVDRGAAHELGARMLVTQ